MFSSRVYFVSVAVKMCHHLRGQQKKKEKPFGIKRFSGVFLSQMDFDAKPENGCAPSSQNFFRSGARVREGVGFTNLLEQLQ